MRPSAAPWVPPGAWLAPGYAEWAPPPALRGLVSCLWASVTPAGAAGTRLVLPDACSDLVWEEGAGAYIAGPDTGPVLASTRPGTVIVGARFRPGAGGLVLGLPLSDLRDQRVPLADALTVPAGTLSPGLTPAAAVTRLRDLTGRLVADAVPDRAIARAVTLLRNPAARAEDIAGSLSLSDRQLRRRSHAAAGYGPKTLQRILRFQRFVQLLDASPRPPDSAASAAWAGYADQPHLTRECAALSGLTPAALAKIRRPNPVTRSLPQKLSLRRLGDHRGADFTEAQPAVDAGHGPVGRR